MRALLCAALALSTSAFAKGEGGGIRDGSHHNRPFQLSFFAVAPFERYYLTGPLGIGGAVRFAIPLVNDGFIRPINDSFELELGANLYTGFSSGPVVVTPIAEVRWTFHLTSHFSAYPKLGFGWNFPVVTPRSLVPTPYFSAAAGLLYEVADWFYLRAEAGYPGVLLGLAFAF